MTTSLRTSHLYDDPGALIAATPGLLGFHPDDSVILITYTGARQLDLESVMRMDLPPADHVTDVAHQLCIVAMNHEAVMVDLIVLGGPRADPPHRLPGRELIDEVSALFKAHNIALAHAAWAPQVTHGRTWWCYNDPNCRGQIHNPATSPLAAAMTTPGTLTHRNRADLATLLTPDPTHLLAPRAALIESLPANPDVQTEYTYLRSTIDTLPDPHTPKPDPDPPAHPIPNDDPESHPNPGTDTQANPEPPSTRDPHLHLSPQTHPDPHHPRFHSVPAPESQADPEPPAHPPAHNPGSHPWLHSGPVNESQVDPEPSAQAPAHNPGLQSAPVPESQVEAESPSVRAPEPGSEPASDPAHALGSRHPWFHSGSGMESQVDPELLSARASEPGLKPAFHHAYDLAPHHPRFHSDRATEPVVDLDSLSAGASESGPEPVSDPIHTPRSRRPWFHSGSGAESHVDPESHQEFRSGGGAKSPLESEFSFGSGESDEDQWSPFGCGPEPDLDDATIARLARAVSIPDVREACLAFPLTHRAARAERLWAVLTRVTPAPLRANPACLLAVSTYLRGEGTLASIALDLAEAADPHHHLTRTLREVIDFGLPPRRFRLMLAESLVASMSDSDTPPDPEPPNTPAPNTPAATAPPPAATPDALTPEAPAPDPTSAHTNNPGTEPDSLPDSRHLRLAHPNAVHGHTRPKHATGPQHLAPPPDSPPTPLPDPPPMPWPEPPPISRPANPKHATTNPESCFSQWEAALARRRAGPEYQARHRAA